MILLTSSKVPLTKSKILTWNIWLRIFTFQNFRKFIPAIVLKVMCEVNTVLGVLYLILIVYYMSDLSSEELSIIFHKNPIIALIRFPYCSEAKEMPQMTYLCSIK